MNLSSDQMNSIWTTKRKYTGREKKDRDWVTCRTLTNDPVTVLLRKENRAEILLKEIMVENSSNLVKDTYLQTQEAELTLNRVNSKKYMLR